MADWGTIPTNKIVTAQDLADAIAAGYFTGTFTGTQKAVKKSELLASNINYDSSNSTLTAKVSNQLLAKRDMSSLTKTWFNDYVSSIAIQSDGKILLTGGFSLYNSSSSIGIIRLNQNGSIDTSFTTGLGLGSNSFVDKSERIAYLSNGYIIVTGRRVTYDGNNSPRIAPVSPNGVFNVAFGLNIGTGFTSIYTAPITRGAIQDAVGDIIVWGAFSSYNNTNRNNIIKLNLYTGSPTSFSATDNPLYSTQYGILDVSSQSYNKLLVSTVTTATGLYPVAISRLNSDGSVDSSFIQGETSARKQIKTIEQVSGKILVLCELSTVYYPSSGSGGTSGFLSNGVFRLNSNGEYDTSFNSGGVGIAGYLSEPYGTTSPTVFDGISFSDNSIIIVGNFISYNGVTCNGVAKLNPDGSLNTSFASNIGSGFNSSARCVAVQSDGKIIIGGSFTSYNGVTRNRIARLNSDGTLDTSF